MALITGTVKVIKTAERTFFDRYKKEEVTKTAYNLGIEQEGQDGLVWVGAGFKSPGVREESCVAIMATQNAQGYWQCKPENIEVTGEAPAPAPAATAPQSQAQPAARPAPSSSYNDKQSSITLQSSFNYSIQFTNALLQSGYLKPAANSKAAKENAQDAIWSFVKKKAAEMHEYFNDPDTFIESQLSDAAQSAIDESDDDMFEDED